jgi:hypothetical protein
MVATAVLPEQKPTAAIVPPVGVVTTVIVALPVIVRVQRPVATTV